MLVVLVALTDAADLLVSGAGVLGEQLPPPLEDLAGHVVRFQLQL